MAALSMPSIASANALGEVLSLSAIGTPFRAEIRLFGDSSAGLADCLRLGPAGASGDGLPWLTQALVTVAGNRALIVVLPGMLALLGLGFWLYARRSERRARLQEWLYRIPVLGRFLYLMALAQITESLALLLENGVDLMRSLDCLRQSPSGWIPLDRAVIELQSRVFEGEELSEAMHSTRSFPTLLINLVAAGESVGTLHPWFARYSRLIEEELQETVDGLVAILEPLMLMFLGGGVGVVVLACFLPTYQLMTTL